MIRKGTMEDVEKIYSIYNLAIETKTQPNWKIDDYPSKNTAIDGIKNNELFVKVFNEEIVGTVILNRCQDSQYKLVEWSEETDKVLVIHTLVISPNHENKNFGSELVEFAKEYGKKLDLDYIRLDTYMDNSKACRLYEKLGYSYRGLVDLKLKNFIGLFRCYDKKIN